MRMTATMWAGRAAVMLCIALATPLHATSTLPVLPIWPKGAPVVADWPGRVSGAVKEEFQSGGADEWSDSVWNVTEPSLQPFLPDRDKATGAAVIVAPGGGFRLLSIRKEGTAVAQWLADHGVAAFVLTYRTIQKMPGESAEAMRVRINADPRLANGVSGAPGVADGLEALRIVRARAGEWGIDPHRVGVVGFSAGGHVAGMMALAPAQADRPDFAGLIYGVPFLNPLPPLPDANLPWPPGTQKEPWLRPKPTAAPGALPPMFMAMAQDDVLVGDGLRAFYDTLFKSGYRPELHIYAWGSHGFGVKPQGSTSDRWIDEFRGWIAAQGLDRARRSGG